MPPFLSWFVAPFGADFVLRALLGGALVAVICAVVGTWVIIRGMAFLGEAIGHGIAGSPATVRDYIARVKEETGVNYVLCQMTFGDMKFGDAEHSIRLFGREVMPQFK